MKKVKEYLHLFKKSETTQDREEVCCNLMSDLIMMTEAASERSKSESYETIKSCESIWRDFVSHPIVSRFYIQAEGFRSTLIAYYDSPVCGYLFKQLGWNYESAKLISTPWVKVDL